MKQTKNKPISKPKIKKTSKKLFGFTLVELIVVITILAILGTIAFVSFNGYSSSSRDSARVTDISNISKSLEVFQINASKYPMPDKYFNVTYSGGIVWYQGIVGDNVLTNLNSSQVKLGSKPVDPLNKKEYTYSILAYGKAFQIKTDKENKEISLFDNVYGNNIYANLITGNNKAFASIEQDITLIQGTYPGVIAQTQTGNITYILAVPSIITGKEMSLLSTIETKDLSGYLLYNNQSTSSGINFTPSVVYSGNSLPSSSTQIEQMISNIQNIYSGTTVASINPSIQQIVESTGSTNLTTLGGGLIENSFGVKINSNSTQTTPTLTNGSCGTAAKTYTSSETVYSGSICLVGTPSPTVPTFPIVGGSQSWSCNGSNGGTNDSCTANRSAAPINGACGTSAKTYLYTETIFTGDFCTSGNPNPATPTFPNTGAAITWTCDGVNGGSNANCSASRDATPVNGSCGTAAKTYTSVESSYGALTFCTSGTASPLSPTFPSAGATITWACNGANGGSNVSCSSKKVNNVNETLASSYYVVYDTNDIDLDGTAEGCNESGLNSPTDYCILKIVSSGMYVSATNDAQKAAWMPNSNDCSTNSDTTYLCGKCNAGTWGGKTNWTMPSMSNLSTIYSNKSKVLGLYSNSGDMYRYWSSNNNGLSGSNYYWSGFAMYNGATDSQAWASKNRRMICVHF